MRPVAFGRPGTQVIPTGWADAHRPTVAGTFTATCSIRHPGGTPGSFDPAPGTTPVTPHEPHYTGDCRIQVLELQDQPHVTGQEQVPTLGYLLVIGAEAAPDTHRGDLLTVTDVGTEGDLRMTGRQLVVQSVNRGSLTWERDLYCTDRLD